MAAPPSISTITTSDAAFKYPLPAVRLFHRQLGVALDEKNARLRTLVGGGYRQLLGTAEMIVDMRRDIEVAEAKMGHVAEGCGRHAISKRVSGMGKFQANGIQYVDRAGNAELSWTARMKVLSGCVIVIGRLVRGKAVTGLEEDKTRGQSLIVAAKALILSRLLVKKLDEDLRSGGTEIEGSEDALDDMKTKLASLRRRLLRSVDKTLEDTKTDREDLAHALSAYSLATSSGAKDVMRHFLHVRGEAMTLCFETDEETDHQENKEERLLRALGLYARSLLDVQGLVPRKLAESLLRLKANPILNDSSILGLEILRLDVYEKWFGDEIVFFTPYIRHDDLDGPQAADTLRGWAKKASQVLLEGFEKTLEQVTNFKAVIDLRTKLLETWILEGGKAKGFDSSIMLDGLRKIINDRIIKLIGNRVTKLHLVGTEVGATLGTWMPSPSHHTESLWSPTLFSIDLTTSATPFKSSILTHLHGRSSSVSRVLASFQTWHTLISELSTTISHLRTQRWADDLENLEDDDESLELRSTLLSKDDPDLFQDYLEESLDREFKTLHQKIASLLLANKESEYIAQMAHFLLRILRGIRAELPSRPDLSAFGVSLVPELHRILAVSVSAAPLDAFTAAISKRKNVIGKVLWEGEPPLPIQPSPATFRFLHALAVEMGDARGDLWSGEAVALLKRRVGREMGRRWIGFLDAPPTWTTAVIPVTEPAAEEEKEKNEEAVEPPPVANGHEDELKEASKAGDDAKGEISNLENGTAVDGGALMPEITPKEDMEENAEAQEQAKKDIFIQSLFDVYVLKAGLVAPSAGLNDTADEDDDGQDLEKLEENLLGRAEVSTAEGERLRKGAVEYWRRTGLLFGVLG